MTTLVVISGMTGAYIWWSPTQDLRAAKKAESPNHVTDNLSEKNSETLSSFITQHLPEDFPDMTDGKTKKNLSSPKHSDSEVVLASREGSELEYPAVGLSVSVSSGAGTSERQPELVLTTTIEGEMRASIPQYLTSRMSERLPFITAAPAYKSVTRIADSNISPFVSIGIGGYSSLGLARFKDFHLSAGMEYQWKNRLRFYSAFRAYTVSQLNNPITSTRISYSETITEVRKTYHTEKLYFAGAEIGISKQWRKISLRGGISVDYLVSGKNRIVQQKSVTQQTISSQETSDHGYVAGFENFSLSLNAALAHQITRNVSAGLSLQFGITDVTRDDIFLNEYYHRNSIAQLFIQYHIQR
jgi:hypothetical protein